LPAALRIGAAERVVAIQYLEHQIARHEQRVFSLDDHGFPVPVSVQWHEGPQYVRKFAFPVQSAHPRKAVHPGKPLGADPIHRISIRTYAVNMFFMEVSADCS
jgi:hypothetical protein